MVSRLSTKGADMAVASLAEVVGIAKLMDLQPVRAAKPITKQREVTRFMFSSLLEVGLEVRLPLIRHQLEKLEGWPCGLLQKGDGGVTVFRHFCVFAAKLQYSGVLKNFQTTPSPLHG
jgi:hypothetical protein